VPLIQPPTAGSQGLSRKTNPRTSAEIYKHEDQWIAQMNRLKRLGYHPDRCLIAAREPKEEADHRGEAYRQISEGLDANDFVWVDEKDTGKLVEFARLQEEPVLKLA